MNKLFENYYKGTCSCGTFVLPKEGFVFKHDGKWVTVCKSCKEKNTSIKPLVKKIFADGTLVYETKDREEYKTACVLIKSFPGARWNPEKNSWTVSVDPKDKIRMLDIAGRLNIEIDSAIDLQDSPDTLAAVARATQAGAFPYQVLGTRWLTTRPKAILADDMGLGKTIQSLMTIVPGSKTIIICPNSLKFNWKNEILKWRPDLSFAILSGKKSFRFPKDNEIVIINYDILPEDYSPVSDDTKNLTVIVDEAHRVKNTKTKRSQSIRKLSKISPKIIFLTGTPLLNKPYDLWGVLTSGGMEKEVFGSFFTFVRLFNGYKGRFCYVFGQPDASVPDRLRRVMLRRTKAEVLPDLPKKLRSEIIVDIPASIKEELDLFWDVTYEDLELLPDFTEFSETRAKLSESRIPAMIDWVEDREEEGIPIVVFSAHRAPIETLKARDGWGVIYGGMKPEERQKVVDNFQAGKLKGIGLTIGAGREGLNLTRSSNMLFVSLDWTPALNLQSEDRCVRIGSTASAVNIFRMISDHPLDKHILALLDEKLALIEKAIENVSSYKNEGGELKEDIDFEDLIKNIKLEKSSKDIEKEFALKKVKNKLSGISSKIKDDFLDIEKERLKEAVCYLASICDGAVERDEQGFNKPDACVGHWLASTGMDDLDSLKLAWYITRKYVRQCKDKFPEIY